jgi:hypothetical protein
VSAPEVRRRVGLLTGQALAFGVAEAFLVIAANAVFLDEFGSEWLPVTYLGIAVVGVLGSTVVATAVRSRPLAHVATVVLGAVGALFLASWVVLATAGSSWVSWPLLVLFPILLQLGFVFIGGQAGRLLDVRQIKELFPRIVSGFAVGFFAGGLLAIPLIPLLGGTEHLLVGAAIAQATFLGLVVVAGRRYRALLTAPEAPAGPATARAPLRRLLAAPFVLLVFGYQVLSAIGSYIVDFLLFDRAAARYPDVDDLGSFLALYTAALNLTNILFLALLAGALLKRFGLRFGLAANPAVVLAALVATAVSAAVGGTASLALFVFAAVARIADITFTDGTTRTSINAAYQVLPVEQRLAVQAGVEGIGVPMAIGFTGILLLAIDALDLSITAVIVAGVGVSVLWTVVALRVYSGYRTGLADSVRRRELGEVEGLLSAPEEAAAIQALLHSTDGREVQLGLDLLRGELSPAVATELGALARSSDLAVRTAALGALEPSSPGAAAVLTLQVARLAASPAAADRRLAAQRAGVADRAVVARLLDDPDPDVRRAALDAVTVADAGQLPVVLAAAGDPATAAAAQRALARLGEEILPTVSAAVDAEPSSVRTRRLVRACRGLPRPAAVAALGPHVRHADRELAGVVRLALADSGPAAAGLSAALDGAVRDEAALARAALGAAIAVDDPLVRRALSDECALARDRALAALAVRYDADAVGRAVLLLRGDDRARHALAVETVETMVGRTTAALVLPLMDPGLDDGERLARLEHALGSEPVPAQGWLGDLALDPTGRWRSSWLRACALHAASLTADPAVERYAAAGRADPDAVVREVAAAVLGGRPAG